MRYAIRMILTTVVFSLTFASNASAQSAVQTVWDKGKSANANFESLDPSGCVVTDVFIFGAIGRHRQSPDPGIDTVVAGVSINKFDRCSSVLLMSAIGAQNTGQFSMGSNLEGATLTASVTLDDFVAGTSFTVEPNLTWIGVGSISRGRSRSRTHEPGVTIVTVFNGSTREATASGTISDGTTNFIPSGSFVNAELQQSDSGEITISHE